jgi:hypothetical protein
LKKYDSGFEKRLDEGPLSIANYHPDRIPYTFPARNTYYEPDWTYRDWVIEAKGRLRATEKAKYFPIRDRVVELGLKFIFVFQNPHLPMPGAKKRKDGSILTHAIWAEKNGFMWTTPEQVLGVINEKEIKKQRVKKKANKTDVATRFRHKRNTSRKWS